MLVLVLVLAPEPALPLVLALEQAPALVREPVLGPEEHHFAKDTLVALPLTSQPSNHG